MNNNLIILLDLKRALLRSLFLSQDPYIPKGISVLDFEVAVMDTIDLHSSFAVSLVPDI
jgi:hypothetical protein